MLCEADGRMGLRKQEGGGKKRRSAEEREARAGPRERALRADPRSGV